MFEKPASHKVTAGGLGDLANGNVRWIEKSTKPNLKIFLIRNTMDGVFSVFREQVSGKGCGLL